MQLSKADTDQLKIALICPNTDLWDQIGASLVLTFISDRTELKEIFQYHLFILTHSQNSHNYENMTKAEKCQNLPLTSQKTQFITQWPIVVRHNFGYAQVMMCSLHDNIAKYHQTMPLFLISSGLTVLQYFLTNARSIRLHSLHSPWWIDTHYSEQINCSKEVFHKCKFRGCSREAACSPQSGCILCQHDLHEIKPMVTVTKTAISQVELEFGVGTRRAADPALCVSKLMTPKV